MKSHGKIAKGNQLMLRRDVSTVTSECMLIPHQLDRKVVLYTSKVATPTHSLWKLILLYTQCTSMVASSYSQEGSQTGTELCTVQWEMSQGAPQTNQKAHKYNLKLTDAIKPHLGKKVPANLLDAQIHVCTQY